MGEIIDSVFLWQQKTHCAQRQYYPILSFNKNNFILINRQAHQLAVVIVQGHSSAHETSMSVVSCKSLSMALDWLCVM